MKKIAYGFEVGTDNGNIRISQEDADRAILISPDEVDAFVLWLQQAKTELSKNEPKKTK